MFHLNRLPPTMTTLSPYTTLFRSSPGPGQGPASAQRERGRRRAGNGEPCQRSPSAVSAASSRPGRADRKSTRLNSSHVASSYAVFCLKKKKKRRQKRILRIHRKYQ